jgi:hypothetical protein
MKIGLSYSRCVRDIVDGTVDIDDVLVVVSRTDFDPHDDEQWKGIWQGYGGGQTFGNPFSNPEWMDYSSEDEIKFRDVSIQLWESGKFHQPRKFGAHPRRLSYYWLDVLPTKQDIDANPATKKAWEQFQILSGLSQPKSTFNDDF